MSKRTITLGSLFDGSGGFPLAGMINGAIPLWAAEIEPYPISVTRERFPYMMHLGSVLDVNGGAIPPVDIITFGSPCQDMSVAGKRAGMQHSAKGDEDTTRSGLFYEAIRIIKEMRSATDGKYPTFAVWENVPGAFSSNKGQDFRCVLEELAQVVRIDISISRPANGKWNSAGEIVGDGFSIAWRMLDAQYWGVPQRRKRIYLVADFADERAGSILFERESMSRNTKPGEAQGQATSDNVGGSIDRSGQPCGGHSSPVIALQGNGIDRKIENGCNGKGFRENEMYTLDVVDRHAVVYEQKSKTRGVCCMNPWDSQTIRQYDVDGIFPALTSNATGGQNRQGVVYEPKSAMEENWDESQVKNALRANASKSSHAVIEPAPPLAVYGVDCRNGTIDEGKTATLQAHVNGGYSLNSTHPILYSAEGENEDL